MATFSTASGTVAVENIETFLYTHSIGHSYHYALISSVG